MTHWPTLTVGDIAAPEARSIAIGPFGSRMKADSYVASGVPVVRGNNIVRTRNPSGDFVFITDEFAESMPGCVLRDGDLVFPHRGAIGEVGLIGGGPESKMMLSTSLMKLRVDRDRMDPEFVYYYFKSRIGRDQLLMRASTVGTPGIGQPLSSLRSIPISVPPMDEQRSIARTLGILDDKIESDQRARAHLRSLGLAKFQQVLDRGSYTKTLEELTTSIARGVSPKYADEDPSAPVVINQKCIRDGWVSLEPARQMHERSVAPAKRAVSGDILVNSTGTGTLGRVARWHEGEIFVDSHVSVVKPDPSKVEPLVLAYALLGREGDIEGLATGSTGQTELSPTRLGSLSVSIPSGASIELAKELLVIEKRADQLASEVVRLTSLRDALLPELLSGRIRVPAARVAA